jgi:hypothetical protein
MSEGQRNRVHSASEHEHIMRIGPLAWAKNRKEVLSYHGIHAWVRRNWGGANRCDLCGAEGLSGRKAHWANKDHNYSRNREDWMMVCRPCHAKYDQEVNGTSFVPHRNR